jgi:hypothetical protein
MPRKLKLKKNRTKKGGAWYNPFSWGKPDDSATAPNATTEQPSFWSKIFGPKTGTAPDANNEPANANEPANENANEPANENDKVGGKKSRKNRGKKSKKSQKRKSYK